MRNFRKFPTPMRQPAVKAPIFLIFPVLCALGAAAEPAPQPPANPPAAPAPPAPRPKLADLIRYKPKAGRDAGGSERAVTAATRNGEEAIRLVALSPGKGALTLLNKPVVWWHQSGPTKHGELQLTLTKMSDKRPETLFASRLTARKTGYQSADLADMTLNPRRLVLLPGETYQWSLAVISGEHKSAIYTTLCYEPNPALEKTLADAPNAPETLTALAAANNWHELFNRVATLAAQHPDNADYAATRDRLLEQAGALKQIQAAKP